MEIVYPRFESWEELFELITNPDNTLVSGFMINSTNNSNVFSIEILRSGKGIIVNGFDRRDSKRAIITESFDPELGAVYVVNGREVWLKSKETEISFEVT